MTTQAYLYFIPIWLSFLISLWLSFFAWQHRRVAGATAFAIYAFAQACWTLGYLFELNADTLQQKILWDDVQYFGFLLAPGAWFVFSREYTGRDNPRFLWPAVVAVPLISMGFVVTNQFHQFISSNAVFIPSEPFGTLIYDLEFGFLGFSVYTFGLSVISFVYLMQYISHAKHQFKAQASLVLVGSMVPNLSMLIGFAGLEYAGQRDITPLGFAVGSAIVAWGLFRYGLFDLVPVARNTAVENMDDIVLVIDPHLRVIDANRAAKKLLAVNVGQHVDDVFAEWKHILARFRDVNEGRADISLGTSHFELRIAPIYNQQEMQGRLIVIHNVTETVNARREAEMMYRIGRKINASTTYKDILQALVDELGPQDYIISLNVFEYYDFATATYITTVASVPVGAREAQTVNVQEEIRLIPQNVLGWLVVEDMNDTTQADDATQAFFLEKNVHAIAVTSIVVSGRTIGTMSFSCDQPRRFSEYERRTLLAVAELAAAALDRTRLYNEQTALVEQLKTLDNVKSQFLASMSHELRTPLNAVLNFTELTAKGYLGPVNERQEDALEKAVGSGRHLLSLINDILDISKIEAGQLKLLIDKEINLNRELDTVIASAESLLGEKADRIKFNKDIDPDLPCIVGDKRRIRQILLNLLANAVKFTDEGSITLSAKHRHGEILFLISDTGPGIREEDRDLIFEPFKQTEKGIVHAGGTGLGLPITQRLVEAHGGRLWVESEVGEGSIFFVSIPVQSQLLSEQLTE
ncbi:MAG: ATP-binding protein [Chloroflexi bacterium]|nr:ATP-binding protein [Chloroflexota bacterium]